MSFIENAPELLGLVEPAIDIGNRLLNLLKRLTDSFHLRRGHVGRGRRHFRPGGMSRQSGKDPTSLLFHVGRQVLHSRGTKMFNGLFQMFHPRIGTFGVWWFFGHDFLTIRGFLLFSFSLLAQLEVTRNRFCLFVSPFTTQTLHLLANGLLDFAFLQALLFLFVHLLFELPLLSTAPNRVFFFLLRLL